MSRRRQASQVGNLDSLLDTMANVTGIMIVLLAVIQLSVGDAMERISDQLATRPELNPASLEAAESEARQLSSALAPLRQQSDALQRARSEGRSELAQLLADNEVSRAAAGAALRHPGDLETLSAALEHSQHDEQELQARVGRARREIAVLDRELALAERAPAQRDIVLPDPRPAPAGAQQLPVFVRHGRVLPVDVRELVAKLRRGTLRASDGQWQFGEGPPNFVDRSQVVAYFQEHDVGTKDFRWHVINRGGREFWAHLEWRDTTRGDTTEDLLAGDSEMARELRRANPRSHYINFFVWDDSFEPYLVAREMAAEAGFASGWAPYSEYVPFRQHLLSTTQRGTVD